MTSTTFIPRDRQNPVPGKAGVETQSALHLQADFGEGYLNILQNHDVASDHTQTFQQSYVIVKPTGIFSEKIDLNLKTNKELETVTQNFTT